MTRKKKRKKEKDVDDKEKKKSGEKKKEEEGRMVKLTFKVLREVNLSGHKGDQKGSDNDRRSSHLLETVITEK